MKNIKKALLLFIGILAVSCTTDDVQDRPVIAGIDAPQLTAPLSEASYVLLPENLSQQAERFVWTKANYGGNVAVTYTIQMDLAGGDFSSPQSLGGAVSAYQASVAVEALNIACLALGASPFQASAFDVRVMSAASGYEPMYSNKITLTITPYSTDLPKLAVPGNHQGWSDANNFESAPRIAASGFGETDYEGYMWLDGGFKFLAPNSSGAFAWGNTDWGDDGSFSDVLAETGESDCSATAGFYRVRANTGAVTTSNPDGMKYSASPVSWGIIGAALTGDDSGWNSDVDLTYNPTTKKLELASVNLVNGFKFKFRGNNAWSNGFDLGTVNADGYLVDGGDLTHTGPTGNYKVILDLSNPRRYTYTLIAL